MLNCEQVLTLNRLNKIEEAFQSLRPIVITEKRQLSKINITLIPPLPPSIRSYLLLCALYESSDILRRPQNFEKISKFFLDVTRYHQKYWKISFFFSNCCGFLIMSELYLHLMSLEKNAVNTMKKKKLFSDLLQYDHTFNTHCCTFYQAFLQAQNQ